jgi:hypothetical protein
VSAFEYEGEFGHYEADTFVCLRCGALVPTSCLDMKDYDDPREKHYNWHRSIR